MQRPVPSMGFVEFIFLVAAMMATQALAVDAMLPAFPAIIRSLHIADPNHGQWVLTAYMVGLGCGQLFWGAMSDRFGRRPILLGGIAVYIVAALACALTHSFNELLLWRFIHGTAAAAATVCRSMIRDLYCGRAMARVISLTIVVFFIVPILAPSLGQLVLLLAPWPYIFLVLGAAASLVGLWALARLRETLHPEYRLTLDRGHIMSAVRLVLTHHTSIGYALASMALFGSVMAYVGMVQQIFSEVFHRPTWMPPLFAACAVFMACAAFLNSRIVERLGMRLISHTALLLLHWTHGVAYSHCSTWHGTIVDIRVASRCDPINVQPGGFEFRSHGARAGGGRGGYWRFLARLRLDFRWRVAGRPCWSLVQQHDSAADTRIVDLWPRESGVCPRRGERAAIPSAASASGWRRGEECCRITADGTLGARAGAAHGSADAPLSLWRDFPKVSIRKPAGSRKESRVVYLVAKAASGDEQTVAGLRI